MSRKQAREGTMQLLFQMESNNDFSQEALDLYLDNFEFEKDEREFIIGTVHGVMEKMDIIDDHIKKHIEGWSLERLAKVDLSTLRLAIYEILFRDDIPVEVSINEAIELVKKYSAFDSYKYVNGVLGGFVRTLDKNE